MYYCRFVSIVAGLVWAAQAKAESSFAQQCLDFDVEAVVPGSRATIREYLHDGAVAESTDPTLSCPTRQQRVVGNLCRIGLVIETSERSGISAELWLPEQWIGGRLLSTGNGGVDGCIKYPDLAYGVSHGFATVGTNNGHDGTSLRALLNNEDTTIDFSHRALHTGTNAGKRIVEAFYGAPAAYSYYLGCSLGGRMGIQAAIMHPEDYDGIIAGAPAVDFNLLQGQRAMFYNVTDGPESPNYIGIDTWNGLIHDEVLRQCDGLDGVMDGIIEVPARCHFEPETLLCAGGCRAHPQSECLNPAQVDQLRRIYADYRWPNGSLLFPRMNPGNEKMATDKLLAGKPFNYSVEYYRYATTGDPSWDMSRFDFDVIAMGDDINPGNIRTYPRSLKTYRENGGKVIVYHGGQDNQITSFNSQRFWKRLAAEEGQDVLDSYYRFFRISGMAHCANGPGAWVFGQGGGGASQGLGFEAEANVLAAMVAWAEEGQAPEYLQGRKFVNDTVSLGVDFERRHCRYPKTQTYVGGDAKKVSSWQCV